MSEHDIKVCQRFVRVVRTSFSVPLGICHMGRKLKCSYVVGVISTISEVLQREPLDPSLPLLKHARASVGWEVELLHHHVLGNADLFPEVQGLWQHNTDK